MSEKYASIGFVSTDVQHGLGWGRASTQLFLCRQCGDVIGNQDWHDKWHESLANLDQANYNKMLNLQTQITKHTHEEGKNG